MQQVNTEKFQELVAFLQKHIKYRPKPNRKFDQFYATSETVVKRALQMESQGDLAGRVIFLGDDDLTSTVSNKLVDKRNQATVVEIDENINKAIKSIAQKENLKIEIVEHDLIEGLPQKLHGQFDTVFTDPPYTPSGMSLFLNCAIDSLRRAFTSRIYLCYGSGEKASDRELAIQEIITEKGLLIREKIHDFNKYQGAATIGNTSSLFILEWTPKTKTSPVLGKRIYTNQ